MRSKKKQILLSSLLFACTLVSANDSIVISRLLHRIEALQVKTDGVFPVGSIPSYRMYAFNKNRYKADINPFFTGLVAFTLRDVMKDLSPAQQQIAHTIIQNANPLYSKFQNKKSPLHTYNFWPTDTPMIFPNAGWLNWLDKSKSLPDDLDDTVILLMAQNESDSIARDIHNLMQLYASGYKKKVTNTLPAYKDFGAYSTWFGKKMPIDFEIGVLANVLYFVQYYNLPWTSADSASLSLIKKIIEDKTHITAAGYISPHYVTLPIILYHVSRLMSLRPIAELEILKPQLIEEAKREIARTHDFMEQVILSTSLLRWGVIPPPVVRKDAKGLEELVEEEDFSFFIANMASILSNPLKQWVGRIGVGRFYYYCPGYNNLLLLENLVWRKRKGIQ